MLIRSCESKIHSHSHKHVGPQVTRTNAHIKVWPRLQTFTYLDTLAWMCRKYRHSHCQGHLLEMSWRLTSAFIPYSRVGGGGHHAHGIPTPRICGRLRKAWIAVTAATGIPRQPGWDCARARKTDPSTSGRDQSRRIPGPHSQWGCVVAGQ